jgi:hypothetical protein
MTNAVIKEKFHHMIHFQDVKPITSVIKSKTAN